MKIFRRTALTRILFFMAADMFLVALSVWLAFSFRFDGNIPEYYYSVILRMILLAECFILPIFYMRGLYSFSWSFVSANEAVSLFFATTLSFIFLAIALYISHYFPYFQNFPRSTIFASYILVFVFTGATRFGKRIYLRLSGRIGTAAKKRTLIIGAGDAGEQILRSIINSKNKPYSPIAFADDNSIKQGISIHGVKVLGRISDIPSIVMEKQITQAIIALPSAGSKVIRTAVETAKKAGIKKIKIAPPISEIINGQVSFKSLRDVDVKDLLGRDQVSLHEKEIKRLIKGKSILITGAAGSIGSELSRQVARFEPSSLSLLDQDETGIFNIVNEIKKEFPDLRTESLIADVTDAMKIEEVFERLEPQIVFHAAAYKHVPLMEKNPDEAIKNNILGTKILASTAIKSGVEKFVFISTDKAVNPTSVMGATKRIGEMICRVSNQKNHAKFISVRFGNVLDSRGSVIPAFREQIARGGPVEVTHAEMKRYFMLISEACLLVLQAGAMGEGGEVFVLDMGEPVKILDLAKDMIRLSGLEPDRDIAVVFVGMRPGEKLFEEMLTAEEGTVATQNKKIFRANLSQVSEDALKNAIDSLESAVYKKDKQQMMEVLKAFVPYYKGVE